MIPDVEVVRADWEGTLADRLANPARLDELWAAVEAMYDAAKRRAGGVPNKTVAKTLVAECYGTIRDILCHSAVGALAPWPAEFWAGSLGRLMHYCFVVTHDDLMYPGEVAKILGVDTPRLGQLQHLGMIDYIVDADARHPRQYARRVTRAMLDDYLERRASPRALARYRAAQGGGTPCKPEDAARAAED